MADIKQAAKWMYEGKAVRRKSERHYVLTPLRDEGGNFTIFTVPNGMAEFAFIDFLRATDWEIAE